MIRSTVLLLGCLLAIFICTDILACKHSPAPRYLHVNAIMAVLTAILFLYGLSLRLLAILARHVYINHLCHEKRVLSLKQSYTALLPSLLSLSTAVVCTSIMYADRPYVHGLLCALVLCECLLARARLTVTNAFAVVSGAVMYYTLICSHHQMYGTWPYGMLMGRTYLAVLMVVLAWALAGCLCAVVVLEMCRLAGCWAGACK